MDPASNANSIPPRTSQHSKFISSASNFLQHEWQGFLQQSKSGLTSRHSQDFIFSPISAKSSKTKRGSWQDFKRKLVHDITRATLLYLAKLLETNRDKTHNFWISQNPCKTTDGKLPGHCKVTRNSKITKQHIAL